MNIVIADDDSAGRKILYHFLSCLKEYTIVGEAANGEELIRYLIMEKPDIALVDINMPFVSGMDAIKSCKELLPDLQVIFITGYDEYAVEALEWNAADYIVKPLMLTRLTQALERAKRLRSLATDVKTGEIENVGKKLIIKHYSNFIFIPMDDIIYIEKVERKTVIYTQNQNQVYYTSESLTELLEKLSDDFIHSHRSYIINKNQVTAIRANNQTYYASFKESKGKAKISKTHIKAIQQALLKQS